MPEIQDFVEIYARYVKNLDVFNNKADPILEFYQNKTLIESVPVKHLNYFAIHQELKVRGWKYESTIPVDPDFEKKWTPAMEAEGEDPTYLDLYPERP